MTKQLTLTGYVLQESSLFYRPGYFIYNNLSNDFGSALYWVLLSPKLSIRESKASCSHRSTSWVEDGIKWNGYKSIRVPQASQYHKPYFLVNLIHILWCTVINIKFLSWYKYLKCGGSLLITKYTGHSERMDNLNTCTPSVFKSRDIFIGLLKNPPSTMWIR